MSRPIFFAVAMLLAAFANVCAFSVLHRMKSLGRNVGYWRWPRKDFALYKEYWNLAPEKNWSRAPLIAGVLCFVLAMYFLFRTGF